MTLLVFSEPVPFFSPFGPCSPVCSLHVRSYPPWLHHSSALHSCWGRAACSDMPVLSAHTAWLNNGPGATRKSELKEAKSSRCTKAKIIFWVGFSCSRDICVWDCAIAVLNQRNYTGLNNALKQHLNHGRDLGYDTFHHVLKRLFCNEEEPRSLFGRRQAASWLVEDWGVREFNKLGGEKFQTFINHHLHGHCSE